MVMCDRLFHKSGPQTIEKFIKSRGFDNVPRDDAQLAPMKFRDEVFTSFFLHNTIKFEAEPKFRS
jgi:hypothetical protein